MNLYTRTKIMLVLIVFVGAARAETIPEDYYHGRYTRGYSAQLYRMGVKSIEQVHAEQRQFQQGWGCSRRVAEPLPIEPPRAATERTDLAYQIPPNASPLTPALLREYVGAQAIRGTFVCKRQGDSAEFLIGVEIFFEFSAPKIKFLNGDATFFEGITRLPHAWYGYDLSASKFHIVFQSNTDSAVTCESQSYSQVAN